VLSSLLLSGSWTEPTVGCMKKYFFSEQYILRIKFCE
jgi:hypothetical protein